MSALSGILSLATSRKAFVAALIPVLMLLNRKFGLGFNDQEVAILACAAGALILGIAVEDHGKNGTSSDVKPIDGQGEPK